MDYPAGQPIMGVPANTGRFLVHAIISPDPRAQQSVLSTPVSANRSRSTLPHPMLNRIVFFVSLLGMILTLHLWIQKQRDFDHGCWGIGAPAAAAAGAGGCRSAELDKVSKLLGVSVAAWGYGFYFFVAAMAFAKMILPARAASAAHVASEVAVALAFPYSCYLVFYQAVVAKAFCPLCLVSAGFITGLFVLHAVQYWRGKFVTIAEDQRGTEIGYAAGMGFVAMGALAAVLLFVNHVGTRGFDEGSNAKEFTTMVGRSLPQFIEGEKLLEMKPVRFDFNVPALKTDEWITNETPALGTPGKVTVVAFLDPNCPSCKGTFAMIEALAERYRGQAAFYVMSRVLWDYSLLQSQALEVARPAGKYFDLWRLQLDRQKCGGLDQPGIEQLFAELGLETANLRQRLAAVRPALEAQRNRAIAAGINSTPTIFINGLAVENLSRDERSLGRLIERAASAPPPQPGTQSAPGKQKEG